MKPAYLPGRLARWLIAAPVGAFVVLPLAMTVEYTFRDLAGGHSGAHWASLIDPARASAWRPLWTGLTNSLVLAAATVLIVLVLVAPTMILINLKFPRLRRVFEFIALLPITIPAIVLAVGLAPIYQVIGRNLGTGAWTLCLIYGVLVLPFAFRAIQASIDTINLTTLAEAARALGASWPQVVWRVLAPNLRTGLLAGSLISVAVVLGEYTIASLLNRQNLQTALVVVNQSDAYVAVIVSLLALALCFVLLWAIGRIGRVARMEDGS
jgi:putative spermidine/putrescine transport system permease protein